VSRNAATKEKYAYALMNIKCCGSFAESEYKHDAKIVAKSLLAGKDLCKRRHIRVGELLAMVATFEDEGSGGSLYHESILTDQVGDPLLLRTARTCTFDEPTPPIFGLEEEWGEDEQAISSDGWCTEMVMEPDLLPRTRKARNIFDEPNFTAEQYLMWVVAFNKIFGSADDFVKTVVSLVERGAADVP